MIDLLPFPSGGQRGVHGAGGGVVVRGLGGGALRQALRPVVAGRDRLHSAVRLPAVPRGLRRRLRLGARRELPRLPGAAVHVHPGGPLLVPRGGVGRHLGRGQGPDPAAAGPRGVAPVKRRARAAAPLAAARVVRGPGAAHAAQHQAQHVGAQPV